MGLGLLVLCGFVGWELGRKHPLLDPRIFRHRHLTAGSVSIFIQFFAFFGFIFLILQYLQGFGGTARSSRRCACSRWRQP